MTRLRFLLGLLGIPMVGKKLVDAIDPNHLPVATGRWADAREGSYEKDGNLFLEIRRFCKVLLDGEDITYGCFYFDEDNGIVGLYLRNENGHFYANDHREVAKEWRRGKVELIIHERKDGK